MCRVLWCVHTMYDPHIKGCSSQAGRASHAGQPADFPHEGRIWCLRWHSDWQRECGLEPDQTWYYPPPLPQPDMLYAAGGAPSPEQPPNVNANAPPSSLSFQINVQQFYSQFAPHEQ